MHVQIGGLKIESSLVGNAKNFAFGDQMTFIIWHSDSVKGQGTKLSLSIAMVVYLVKNESRK